MDSVTHVLSGAVAALAIPKHLRPTSRLFIPLAAVAGVLPDADVLFINSPINFLLLHRGLSHALVAIPFMALLLTILGFPLWSRLGRADARIENGQMLRTIWPFWKVLVFFSLVLLLHLWLDCVTTFGTMIFLPFSEYRVRLNGLFIIDLLLTIPIILAIWNGFRERRYALIGLIWMLVYPATCVTLRYVHEAEIYAQLKTPQMIQKVGNVQQLTVLPDIFSPFFWRTIYQTDKPFRPSLADAFTWPQSKSRMGYTFKASSESVYQQGLTMLATPRTPLLQYPALDKEMAAQLRHISRRARAFEDFSVMPIQESFAVSLKGNEIYGIYDLRFGTMFSSIYKILLDNSNGNPTFLMEVKRKNGHWDKVRLIFSGSGMDSGWQNMQAAQPTTWWQKLIGITY